MANEETDETMNALEKGNDVEVVEEGQVTVVIMAYPFVSSGRFKSKKWMDIDLFKRRRPGVPIQNGAAVE